ncbi:kinase-like protein [Stipitochalara longipes BDJ]|nr:kinase-like protein [Stipitochalara longipes BDJ]
MIPGISRDIEVHQDPKAMEAEQSSIGTVNRAAACVANLGLIRDLAWPDQNDQCVGDELTLLSSLIYDLRTFQSDISSVQSNKPRASEVSNPNVAALISLQLDFIEDGINKARKPAEKIGSRKESGCLCWRSDRRSREEATKSLSSILFSLKHSTQTLLKVSGDLSHNTTDSADAEAKWIDNEVEETQKEEDVTVTNIKKSTTPGEKVFFGKYKFIWDQIPDPRNKDLWQNDCADGVILEDTDVQTTQIFLKRFEEGWRKLQFRSDNLIPNPDKLHLLTKTCLILKALGMTGQQLVRLLEKGYDDNSLPLTKDDLKTTDIAGIEAESFLIQQYRACRRCLNDSNHLKLGNFEPLPLKRCPDKTQPHKGSFSYVEIVKDVFPPRDTYLKKWHDDPRFKNHLQQEKDILQRLNHDHIVKFVKSFERSRDWGMLLSPVADMDLSNYINKCFDRDPSGPNPQERINFLKIFGCLSVGLEHIHSHKVRHKDIKPDNIVCLSQKADCRFLWVDFGVSHAFSQGNSSVTTNAAIYTPRYAAPEFNGVSNKESSHDYPADIFSFGLVFLEVLSFLVGEGIRGKENRKDDTSRLLFQDCAPGESRFSQNIPKVKEWINTQLYDINNGRPKLNRDLRVPFEIAFKMIDGDPYSRPPIGNITKTFFDANQSYFCERCRRSLREKSKVA